MWSGKHKPLVVAHRGERIHAPENTLAAFEMAADHGADGIEFDVKLSRDGKVIIIHDQTVDRTTNGTGKVKDLTLAQLKGLDAGIQFPEKFTGEQIPTLSEVFENVGKRLFMNVELTNYATPWDELVPRVADLVIKHGVQDRVFYSSFFPVNLYKAGKLLPGIPRGLLTWSGWMGWWGRNVSFRSKTYQALNPFLTDVNSDLIKRVHASGKQVFAWTVNSPEEIKRMMDLGVDGIITDDPVLTLQIVGRNQ
jgi:glycerophosphoryl diester phosphodiesterase